MFDFTIVIVSIVGILLDLLAGALPLDPAFLRVFRIFRIVRILRIVRHAKGLRTLLMTLALSGPSLLNIGMLLFLIMFVFSIIGMSLFKNVIHNGAINDFTNFENFLVSGHVTFE